MWVCAADRNAEHSSRSLPKWVWSCGQWLPVEVKASSREWPSDDVHAAHLDLQESRKDPWAQK